MCGCSVTPLSTEISDVSNWKLKIKLCVHFYFLFVSYCYKYDGYQNIPQWNTEKVLWMFCKHERIRKNPHPFNFQVSAAETSGCAQCIE